MLLILAVRGHGIAAVIGLERDAMIATDWLAVYRKNGLKPG